MVGNKTEMTEEQVQNFMKYILEKGSLSDKQKLLESISEKLGVVDKQICRI